MLLSTNSWNFCPVESRSELKAISGKTNDFFSRKLYKATGPDDGAAGGWSAAGRAAGDGTGLGSCWGASCANTAPAMAKAIAPQKTIPRNNDRRQARLDFESAADGEQLISCRNGIAREYSIASPSATPGEPHPPYWRSAPAA